MKRIVITPCCRHEQATKKNVGELVRCSRCKGPFVEAGVWKNRR